MLKDLRDIALFLWGVLQAAWFLGSATIHGVAALARRRPNWMQNAKARAQQRRADRLQPPTQVKVKLPQAAAADLAETGPATILQASPYQVADRIVTIRLEPPVGIINLRVYKDERVVRRDLIVNEPKLRGMMRGRRHSLPDAPFDPVKGLEAIKEETIGAVERLINELGNQAVKALRPPKKERREPPPRVERPVEDRKPAAAVVPVSQSAAPKAEVFVPRAVKGIAYAGLLVKAGSQMQRPPGRPAFETFEAVLALDNGVEFPLRGAELERELLAAGCEIGQRVEITPLGKVPVTLSNGDEGKKNLYKVRNLSAGAR
jgi:hypothetical protein